jgi:hypothetical protein
MKSNILTRYQPGRFGADAGAARLDHQNCVFTVGKIREMRDETAHWYRLPTRQFAQNAVPQRCADDPDQGMTNAR